MIVHCHPSQGLFHAAVMRTVKRLGVSRADFEAWLRSGRKARGMRRSGHQRRLGVAREKGGYVTSQENRRAAVFVAAEVPAGRSMNRPALATL